MKTSTNAAEYNDVIVFNAGCCKLNCPPALMRKAAAHKTKHLVSKRLLHFDQITGFNVYLWLSEIISQHN
jgi:hypothetical protein